MIQQNIPIRHMHYIQQIFPLIQKPFATHVRCFQRKRNVHVTSYIDLSEMVCKQYGTMDHEL